MNSLNDFKVGNCSSLLEALKAHFTTNTDASHIIDWTFNPYVIDNKVEYLFHTRETAILICEMERTILRDTISYILINLRPLDTEDIVRLRNVLFTIIIAIEPDFREVVNLIQDNPHHISKFLGDHLINTLVNVSSNSLELKLAALFHDISKPECKIMEDGIARYFGHAEKGAVKVVDILETLGYDKSTIDRVSLLIKYHHIYHNVFNEKTLDTLVKKLGIDGIKNLFKLWEADKISHKPPYNFDKIDNWKFHFRMKYLW